MMMIISPLINVSGSDARTGHDGLRELLAATIIIIVYTRPGLVSPYHTQLHDIGTTT